MPPVLFCLYLNVLLFALPCHVTAPPSRHESGQAFVNDLLYRSEDGDRIQQILNFFDTVAREWGLHLNLSKTEIHAMGTAPPRAVTSPSGTPLSTTNQKTGQPHSCYKYLGEYIFTTNHAAQTLAWAKSEIRSFFTTLQPLLLNLSEYVLLVNVQLIPILSYCLMAHPLALNESGVLQAMIWQNIAHDPAPEKANRISRLVSPKARYTPRHQGGLGLRHFTFFLCMALVNTAVRYLNADGAVSTRDAGSNSHEFARIRIRPEFARIRGPLRTRIRNFKFECSLIRLIESIGTYNLPSRLQFTCLHMGMPLPSTISHKRFPKSFRNLAIFVVCCCLHLPCSNDLTI